ncbi:MAG: DHA2 family efflux MFS transporter permease subunit [Nitrososphaerales archaeon]|jgi:EmrB/QacA subfamily drug resistance transporter
MAGLAREASAAEKGERDREGAARAAPGRRLAPAAQFGLIAGPFLSMIDSNVVNVALPVIQADFHSSLSSVQWVLSGYLLALGAVLVSSAYLSKRFGAKRVYLVSLLGFTAASGLCALSPSLDLLVLARVAQGGLGALLVPLAMDMLMGKGGASRQISPVFGMILFLAPALGPTLGGALIALAGWPSVFLINVPLGAASALLVARSLGLPAVPVEDGGRGAATPRFDPVGSAVLSAGIVLAIYGSTEGPTTGWTSAGSLPFWASGGLLLALYGVYAHRSTRPAVDLKLLRNGQAALALGVSNVANVVLFSMLVLLPVFLETARGASTTVTGLVLLPQGLVTGVGILLGDRLTRRGSVRRVTLAGFAVLTVTTAALLFVGEGTPLWTVAADLGGRGLALGLTIQPLLTATIGDLSGPEVPDGNTLFNVMERISSSVGISVLATFFQLSERGHLLSSPAQPAGAAADAFHDVVLVLAVLSLVGLGLSSFLRGSGEQGKGAEKGERHRRRPSEADPSNGGRSESPASLRATRSSRVRSDRRPNEGRLGRATSAPGWRPGRDVEPPVTGSGRPGFSLLRIVPGLYEAVRGAPR